MRLSRKMGLIGKLPTFAEIFSNYQYWYTNMFNSATSAVRTASRPSKMYDGHTWYLFFAAGGSLELSRMYANNDGTMNKTRLFTIGSRRTVLTDDATGVKTYEAGVGDLSLNACSMLWIEFKHSPTTIDKMFKLVDRGVHKSYFDPDIVSDDTALMYGKSNIANKPGVILAMFRDSVTATNCWSVADSQTPTTAIVGRRGGVDGSALRDYTYATAPMVVPTANGSSAPSVRSYTLGYFSETW